MSNGREEIFLTHLSSGLDCLFVLLYSLLNFCPSLVRQSVADLCDRLSAIERTMFSKFIGRRCFSWSNFCCSLVLKRLSRQWQSLNRALTKRLQVDLKMLIASLVFRGDLILSPAGTRPRYMSMSMYIYSLCLCLCICLCMCIYVYVYGYVYVYVYVYM